MTVPEMETALETMTVIVDSREQNTPSLKARIKQIENCGCKTERGKVNFGDYMAKFFSGAGEALIPPVSIERKMGLEELSQCFFQQRPRFEREFVRAKNANAKVYLLVENASIDSVYAHAYTTQVNPHSYIASIMSWLARYNCQLIFCAPTMTGRVIHDVLYYEGREYMKGVIESVNFD